MARVVKSELRFGPAAFFTFFTFVFFFSAPPLLDPPFEPPLALAAAIDSTFVNDIEVCEMISDHSLGFTMLLAA